MKKLIFGTKSRAMLVFAVVVMGLVILSGGRAAAAFPAVPAQPPPQPPTGQFIVKFADPAGRSVAPADMARRMDRLSTAAGRSLTLLRPMSGDAYVFQMATPVDAPTAKAIARDLAALPEVAYAQPGATWQHMGIRVAGSPRAADKSPDDPAFADQWHYRYTPGSEEGINVPPAWNITTGSADIVVAVIDTGILPHADLAGRTVPGYDFITSPQQANDNDHQSENNSRDADPSDPGDWAEPGDCPGGRASSSSWHGTHVAGTIGAASNNGSGVAGINWVSKILPVRVLGRCGGESADVIDAIRWAAGLPVPGVPPNPNPARVLNLSLGGQGICGQAEQAAVADVVAAGVVVVVAAGNDSNIADFYTPASCEGVITVAAATREGDLTYYSNYGSTIEVSAPGGETPGNAANGILSTLNDGATVPGKDSLAFYQGTSMATPHVAGVASLLLSVEPSLTPAQVSGIIQATARDFPEGSFCAPWACGEGLVDAFAALSALDELLPPKLVAPVDEATINEPVVALEWSAVPNAETYTLEIAADTTFDAPLVSHTGEATTFTTEPLAAGVYYWRVFALAGEEIGPLSSVWSFTIETLGPPPCEPPAAPALLQPGEGATLNDGVVLYEWSSVQAASRYELQVAATPDFAAPLVEETTIAATYQATDSLEPGLYYWRVRGRNLSEACDLAGEWSAAGSFTVEQEVIPPDFVAFMPVLVRP
ncbi:MAG: S8 family serine peptidase [Anaerolineae bacterium]|uniref:S8 family serine peptidase n=1 Tax=Promineifilum sp. TaxID=2664178 RepID=UPI001DA319E7|nr:S8 family serine peptidase [Anaerolineales bacterium]MCB8936394.1 S8 family serine peptidase [Promineifilum sp.]MCO5179316.1 S8 family serine peptidase [Promineifilum sp.]MCW5848224.1 S8 family serine peptidase [Anaerolineae bacterium]